MSHCEATRELLFMDLVISSHGQLTRMTPEKVLFSRDLPPRQREHFESRQIELTSAPFLSGTTFYHRILMTLITSLAW
ncbi:hypothetical protein TNCV_2927881 [Trichonephila clavipes]|nr:hypothetical protein TNCV_2927881 [Trichonephila clavipes]